MLLQWRWRWTEHTLDRSFWNLAINLNVIKFLYFNLFTAPLKIVPRSEIVKNDRLLRLINRYITLMRQSVSNDTTSSMCMARVDLQRKYNHTLSALIAFASNIMNQRSQTPDLENEGLLFTNKNFCFSADRTYYSVSKWLIVILSDKQYDHVVLTRKCYLTFC